MFFFFLHPSQGGVSAGGGSPRGHFPGTTRAQVPSPLPQVDPVPPFPKRAPTLPRAGRQVTGRGLASPYAGGPRPLLSEGDGTLGISAYTGSLRAEGLTNPTPPRLREGSVGQASVPAPLLWDGSLLRAQAVKRHSPGPLGSEPNGGVCPRAPPRGHMPPQVPGGWHRPYRNLPSPFLTWRMPGSPGPVPLTLKRNWCSCFPRKSRGLTDGDTEAPKYDF